MTYDKLFAMRKKIKSMTFPEFCKLSPDQRDQLGIYTNESEKKDIEECIKIFPIIEIKVEFYVDGEKEIAVGDFVTYKITVTQKNLAEGEKMGFIHSNKYPFLKQNNWYLLFVDLDEMNFMKIERLNFKEKETVLTEKQRIM